MRNLRRRTGIAAVLSVLAASGCSIFTEGSASPQDELDEHLALWNGAGIQRYSVQFQRVCLFCAPALVIPVRLTVLDGLIVEVLDADSNEPVDSPFEGAYLTIEQIFDAIQQAIDSDADDIDVRYDDTLGYPLDVDIDQNRRTFNDELGFLLRDFQQLN